MPLSRLRSPTNTIGPSGLGTTSSATSSSGMKFGITTYGLLPASKVLSATTEETGTNTSTWRVRERQATALAVATIGPTNDPCHEAAQRRQAMGSGPGHTSSPRISRFVAHTWLYSC